MYAQDDLTQELFDIENGDGFLFTNAPDPFSFAEWLVFSAYLPEYKFDYLLGNAVKEAYRVFSDA